MRVAVKASQSRNRNAFVYTNMWLPPKCLTISQTVCATILAEYVVVSGKNDSFGEDIKKTWKRHVANGLPSYRSFYRVRALSYCDLHCIFIGDLVEILDEYPEFTVDFLKTFVITFSLNISVRTLLSLLPNFAPLFCASWGLKYSYNNISD